MADDPTPTLFPMEDFSWALPHQVPRPSSLLDLLGQARIPHPFRQTHIRPATYPQRLPTRFRPSVIARAAIVMHLRERQNLNFREISRLLHYKGSGDTRGVYLRGCTLRRLFTSELPPEVRAAWRSQLTSALFPSADIDPTPEEDSAQTP
jgi:hypothetical protein